MLGLMGADVRLQTHLAYLKEISRVCGTGDGPVVAFLPSAGTVVASKSPEISYV